MIKEKIHLQQHAKGDEKETGKDIPKRQDIARGLMPVLGFRDDQPGQEGPFALAEQPGLGVGGKGVSGSAASPPESPLPGCDHRLPGASVLGAETLQGGPSLNQRGLRPKP
jgi:hypothetical protein